MLYYRGTPKYLIYTRGIRRAGLLNDRKEESMDTKVAMKIVAEQVIVKGDSRIEKALQTVENTLGLEPVISHGAGEPFHYVEKKVDLLGYFLDDSNWGEHSNGIQHFKNDAYSINSYELPDYEEFYETLANDSRVADLCQTRPSPKLVNQIWLFTVGETAYQIDVWPYNDVTPYQIRRWSIADYGC